MQVNDHNLLINLLCKYGQSPLSMPWKVSVYVEIRSKAAQSLTPHSTSKKETNSKAAQSVTPHSTSKKETNSIKCTQFKSCKTRGMWSFGQGLGHSIVSMLCITEKSVDAKPSTVQRKGESEMSLPPHSTLNNKKQREKA
jgi:hypothetical protein